MFVSHLPEFLDTLDLPAAARAMGQTAVSCVRAQMLSGYQRPVYRTGALMRDVTFVQEGPSVVIGNTLPYAGYVHDGTCRMAGRPYLADGILSNPSALAKAAAEALRK